MGSVNTNHFLSDGTDPEALALDIYTGVFAQAFREKALLLDSSLDLIDRRSPGFGSRSQFLLEGDTPAPDDFTPGDQMVGQQYEVEEKFITTDKYLVQHNYIPKDDVLKAHFSVMPRLAKNHANRMARELNRRLFIMNALGARDTALTKNGINIHNGGNRVTRTGGISTAYPLSTTGASNLIEDIRQLAELMDEDNIPPDSRYIVGTPYIRHVLQFGGAEVFSTDYTTDNNLQRREFKTLSGFKILGWANTTSNSGIFPDQNIVTGLSKFQGDFSVQATDGTPVIQAFSTGPDGQYPLILDTRDSLTHDVEWDVSRLSYLVATYAHISVDRMYPYCSGSIEVIS